MEIKDIIQNKEETPENAPVYMPSSSEKKRAVLMYLFIGIMVYLSKTEVNVFEYYHLKQATGWWIMFLLILVLSAVLLFLPIIKIIGVLLLLIFIAARIIGVKQAWDGKYQNTSMTSFMSLFSGVGNWFLDLFEINPKTVNSGEGEMINAGDQPKAQPADDETSGEDTQVDTSSQ